MEANVRQQDFNSIRDYLVMHSGRMTALIFVFDRKAAHKQSENRQTFCFSSEMCFKLFANNKPDIIERCEKLRDETSFIYTGNTVAAVKQYTENQI